METQQKQIVKGYKIFNPDFTCKDKQYAENTRYKYDGAIKICSTGLHFCLKASDCFSYYSFDPNNIVCEVEAHGDVQYKDDDSKACTNDLFVCRRLTWQEVLLVANEGANNTGHSNSGNRNSGYSNSGNWNSGNRNSGDSNSGYRNSGAFCIDSNPKLILFDKLTDISVRDWENSNAVDIMNRLLENTIWISSSSMNKDEKEKHPTHETTGGYLKIKTMQEAWRDMWGNLGKEERQVFIELPNFDAKKFEIITGIKI